MIVVSVSPLVCHTFVSATPPKRLDGFSSNFQGMLIYNVDVHLLFYILITCIFGFPIAYNIDMSGAGGIYL